MPDTCLHHRLYLINFVHPGPWISFRVCIFVLSSPCCCVFSLVLSRSRSYHMRVLPFPPLVVHVFYPTFLPFPCLYSPLDLRSPNPVLHPITEPLIKTTFFLFPTPHLSLRTCIYLGAPSKKMSRNFGKVAPPLALCPVIHPYLF